MSNPNLVTRATVAALSVGGFILLWLNLGLINDSLYTYGIWVVPPLGASIGLLLFGFIWGGRAILRYMRMLRNG